MGEEEGGEELGALDPLFEPFFKQTTYNIQVAKKW